jgi:hypothetical protein
MDCVTRETAGRGAQQERGGRSGCRGRGALGGGIAPVAKAMAVLDKGRRQTAQDVEALGKGKLTGSLG